MDTIETLRKLLVPLSAAEVASVMTIFSGLLEAMPADDEDGSDAPLRGRIETLLIGYESGLKR